MWKRGSIKGPIRTVAVAVAGGMMRRAQSEAEGERERRQRQFEIYGAAVSFDSAVDHFSHRRFEGLSPFAFPSSAPPKCVPLTEQLSIRHAHLPTHSMLGPKEIGGS